jgi:hypothetical protein
MQEDPSGFVEWVLAVAVGLFGLFLIVCVLAVIWEQVVARLWRLIRGRNESVHHRLQDALPPEPVDTRAHLREEVGSFEELVLELEPRLRQRASEVMKRDPGDATANATELARRVFERWDEAGGRVPRLRAELPPESRRFPLGAAEFVKEWNESTWLHTAEHAKLRVEDLHAGPFMSGHAFVDWNVEHWAWELDREVSLNCCDIGFLPLFLVVPIAAGLDGLGLPTWLAILLALIPVVPFLYGWRWLRRRGYVTMGDD